MNDNFNIPGLILGFFFKLIIEFVFKILFQTKGGRWLLGIGLLCSLPFLASVLDDKSSVVSNVLTPKDNNRTVQEAVDGLKRECIAQGSEFWRKGRMYNNTNDPKPNGRYYYFGLIKYGRYERIAPIYAEPKNSNLSTFVGVAVMSSQNKLYCLICRASPHHNVVLSKDLPVFTGTSVDCPTGYSLFQRVERF
jgi:hypothetical protein